MHIAILLISSHFSLLAADNSEFVQVHVNASVHAGRAAACIFPSADTNWASLENAYIKSHRNQWMRDNKGNPDVANHDPMESQNTWEKWTISTAHKVQSQFYIKSHRSEYLRDREDKNNDVDMSTVAQTWEKWIISPVSGKDQKVFITSERNKLQLEDRNGNVNLRGDKGTYQEWTIGLVSPQGTCSYKQWPRCACENKESDTHPDCTMEKQCSCVGYVRLGYGGTWSSWKDVSGSIDCTNSVFGGDPVPGQAKECQCKKYECTCENGQKVTDNRCTAQNANICDTCNDGYALDGQNCRPNECTCENGTPVTSDQCTTDKANICGACDNGYFLPDGQTSCKPKMSCADKTEGFVDLGESITSGANKWAKSCPVKSPNVLTSAFCNTAKCMVDPDRNNCCRSNVCTCDKGTATIAATAGGADGTLCQTDGAEDCSACNDGYHLSAEAALGTQTCLANVCQCSHGTATVATGSGSTFCAKQGDQDCSSCKPGYSLSAEAKEGSQTCIANVCTCSGGVNTHAGGAGGTLCKTDGTEDCSSCDAGYSISGPIDENLQTCEPNTCSKTKLPTDKQYDTSDCDKSVVTGEGCKVGCADGYTGADVTWTCSTSGDLTGDNPTCEAQKCNNISSQLFTSHTTSHNCTDLKTGGTCTASCNAGYSGAAQTYSCSSTGFGGEAMACEPTTCDASHSVQNGDNGDCTSSLDSGRSCTITCNEGYTRDGLTQCLAGTLTSVASCKPSPCDASESPVSGTPGDCTSNLESGKTCQPTCNDGYTVSGTSSCDKGVLKPATCKAALACTLVYKKDCADRYGYWSDADEDLDYPGCEAFCNRMYVSKGKTVKGCELAAVADAARNSKGKWCFAHENECSIGEREYQAAAKCVPLVR